MSSKARKNRHYFPLGRTLSSRRAPPWAARWRPVPALAVAATLALAASAGAQGRCPADFTAALEGLAAAPGGEVALETLAATRLADVIARHGGVEPGRAALRRRAALLRAEAAGGDAQSEVLAHAHERMAAALDCRPD